MTILKLIKHLYCALINFYVNEMLLRYNFYLISLNFLLTTDILFYLSVGLLEKNIKFKDK